MSRQRLRPSLAEASFIACPHCAGTGHVRSTENAAIHVLRGIEEEGGKRRAAEILVHVATPIALYLLNHKRERLQEIEQRYGMRAIVAADDAQTGSDYRIDRTRARAEGEFVPVAAPAGLPPLSASAHMEAEDEDLVRNEDESDETPAAPPTASPGPTSARAETADETAEGGKRRRRRRRRGRREDGSPSQPGDADGDDGDSEGEDAAYDDAIAAEPNEETEASAPAEEPASDAPAEGDDDGKNRRRGRRGGRRKRRDGTEGDLLPIAEPDAEQPALPPVPVYVGPTPANPFGGEVFDIFDVLEQAEQRAAASVHVVEPQAHPQPVAEPEPVAEVAPLAAEPEPVMAVVEAAPEPVVDAEPEPKPAPEPVVVAEIAPGPEPEPVPEPEPELVLEPVAGAAIQPVVIGEAPPVEKKRGWWRR
jgi:ribonuclease E